MGEEGWKGRWGGQGGSYREDQNFIWGLFAFFFFFFILELLTYQQDVESQGMGVHACTCIAQELRQEGHLC